MSVFPFMVCLFFPYHLVLLSSGNDYYAELPERITALSGSCVQIPCTFAVAENEVNNVKNIFGSWIKTDHHFENKNNWVVFNGSRNIIRGFSHIEIIGNLSQRECTTVFYDVMMNHSDNYYFRVELEMSQNSWKYTYMNNTNISISDSPQPLILKPNGLKEVMENTTVNLTCSAEAPCPKQPPKISWTNIFESANITTQLQEKPDKTQSVFSHMTFKASYMDHRKNISCTATYPRKTSNDTVETSLMLQVLFPPKETHITVDPSASVSVDTNVTLTCKSKASPSNNMSLFWHKRGQDNHLDVGETLTFTVNRRSGGWYFCIAKNEHGIQNSNEIQLIVLESLSLSLIIGCVLGVSAFLLIFLLITLFLRVQRIKASTIRETDVSHQCQEKQVAISSVYANGAFVSGEELEMPKDQNDIVHYGAIDFSTSQTKGTTVKSSGQETIYSEVRGPEKEMNQD